ncbi:hypothetical protein [Kutzneria sp. CA-103260]|uniref:hypothetical protein n=1 Tax=Kutzneria sp. CA-103260 TaxID=2802641 RepID=UPI001BA966A0|nr:hypothetical protein [Kutzneria sp. CA-103260]
MRLSVNAVGFAAAQQQAHNAMMPTLSQLAFGADVSLEVTTTIMTERATDTRRVGTTLAGAVQPAPELRGLKHREARAVPVHLPRGPQLEDAVLPGAALLQDHQGFAKFHTRRVRAAARANTKPPPAPMTARIPANVADLPPMTEWARDLFTPFLGQTFSEVDTATGRTIRNAVAHLTPGMDPTVADYLGDIHACQQVVPVLRYIARELIQGELAYAAAQFAPAHPAVIGASESP